MRVLISAYTCAPDGTSEPGVGWAFVCAAARRHEVTVLTQAQNASAIAAAFDRDGRRPRVTIVPVRGPQRLQRHTGRLGLGHLDYVIWQWRAWRVARRLAPDVDVAHHVTFGNDWLPCALHFLPGVPVIWGPVGGTAPVPYRLMRFMSPVGLTRELARELITRLARLVTVRLVTRRGCTVVATNRDVARRFAGRARRVIVEPHVALPPAPVAADLQPRETNGRVAVYAARLSSWKGPYLALEALTHASADWRLDIYGAGEDSARLHRRVDRLGLQSRVRLMGARPLDEVREALRQADAMLFPSMHDSSPFAVGEAVRAGCPVVCLDVGGPPLLIEGTPGIAVPADRATPAALAEALEAVHRHDPSDRWSVERLPARVDAWYADAVTSPWPGSRVRTSVSRRTAPAREVP